MLKRSLLAVAAVLILSAPALAASCPSHMAAIDAALAAGPSLSAEQMDQVKALRAQGEEQHKAGQHAESVESLQEAKKVLGIE